MHAVGGALTDHVSCIAHILPNEWEGLIGVASLEYQPINLISRSKLRQVLLTARIVVGLVSDTRTSTSAAAQTTPVYPAPPDSIDDLRTVNINDVIAQGVEPIRVKLITDEEFQEPFRGL